MPETPELNYYLLFANYTHGLALQELLRGEALPSRIVPTPRSIQGALSCGMSLLVKPEHIERVRDCMQRNQAAYHDIVALPCQISPGETNFAEMSGTLPGRVSGESRAAPERPGQRGYPCLSM